MSSEKELRSFILSRFFLVLAIVTVVELIVVYLTNSFILPAVIKNLNFDMLFSIKSVERFILISFVIIVALIINKILPIFKVSPSSITIWLSTILANYGYSTNDVNEVSRMINDIKENPKSVIFLVLWLLLAAVILVTPYVTGGILYSIAVAKKIRGLEREKEQERLDEERRRYLMISNIVHDLKTPMTTVYGYAKALNDGVVPDDKKEEYNEAIMAKTERMNEVVAMLLDYVKLDSEGFQIKKERIDICELVRACCAFSYTDIESAGDEIDIDIPERAIYVEADGKQFSRVITNLITNAIRHNPEGVKIKVSVRSESESTAEDVRIFVADSGDEISEELRNHIFEPFFTGDESRASDSGTGLGLPLSSRICDMHGFKLKLVQMPDMLRYRLGDEYKKVFVISL